jgi:hypothetical protein
MRWRVSFRFPSFTSISALFSRIATISELTLHTRHRMAQQRSGGGCAAAAAASRSRRRPLFTDRSISGRALPRDVPALRRERLKRPARFCALRFPHLQCRCRCGSGEPSLRRRCARRAASRCRRGRRTPWRASPLIALTPQAWVW